MNRYIFIGLLCFVIGACTHHTTGFYEGPRYLSFVNEKEPILHLFLLPIIPEHRLMKLLLF